MSLSAAERERYARHILLKEIGGPGQQALKRATVALVGMGGLGAPAALYLAAAGVGTLRLIDHDSVSLSNLQRQVLYRTDDVDALKVAAAAAQLGAINPHVVVDVRAVRLHGPPASLPADADDAEDAEDAGRDAGGPGNARELLAGADVVLDGTDDFAVRYAVNAACHELGITLVSGAVGRWDGQIATFKSGKTKGRPAKARLPCYRCLVPEIPPETEPCSAVGIVGALTGVVGALMALEAIKEIADAGDTLAGRLMIFDGLAMEARTVQLPADPECVVCSG